MSVQQWEGSQVGYAHTLEDTMTHDIATRLSSIVAAHEAARSTVGASGATRRTKLAELRAAGTRAAADIVGSQELARSARRLDEQARHAEAGRLFARMTSIQAAISSCDDDARRARLELLLGDVESARDRYMHATWQRQAQESDWAPRGRFANYARRFDLGFISMSSEDIAQEAAELLTIAHTIALTEGADVLSQGEPTPDGSRTLPHTIGDAYRAIRHAYRRGLGFYGYERRGTVIERDDSPRGYTTADSWTVETLRMRGADESQLRARIMQADDDELDELDDDERAELPMIERRRAALATLTRRFPLNADGRMLALATLLTEGYDLGELTSGLGLTESTLDRWAHELGALAS